jgi:mono/diheme cytochrome c family protein
VEAALRDRTPASAPALAPATPQVERGRYLVAAGDCVACHTTPGGAAFAGGRAIDTPFGVVRSTNITPDETHGLGRWSADDFWQALHDGRSKDGRLLYPAFPYPNFTRVRREDSDAMYAYLRTLPSVAQANVPHALRFPYDTQLALAAWRAVFFRPGAFVPDATKSERWNRGAYLVRGLGHCDACHAARNVFGAVAHDVDLGGGLIPLQNWYAPPLASGPIARWPAAEIEALLRTGIAPRGAAMGPMAEVVWRSTQFLTPADAGAIAEYLQSAGHARGDDDVPGAQRAEPDVLARGERIYGEHCADCHGRNGEGVPPAYPALAGNASSTGATAANAIKAVLYGGYPPVTAGNPRPYGMPPYFATLKAPDVAAVLTYVRESWGNGGAPVSTVDVERYRTLR